MQTPDRTAAHAAETWDDPADPHDAFGLRANPLQGLLDLMLAHRIVADLMRGGVVRPDDYPDVDRATFDRALGALVRFWNRPTLH